MVSLVCRYGSYVVRTSSLRHDNVVMYKPDTYSCDQQNSEEKKMLRGQPCNVKCQCTDLNWVHVCASSKLSMGGQRMCVQTLGTFSEFPWPQLYIHLQRVKCGILFDAVIGGSLTYAIGSGLVYIHLCVSDLSGM